jgi:hypothetical protein
MIIVTMMKAVRDIWIETIELRRMLAKRYPMVLND